jgi:hypothetical protein
VSFIRFLRLYLLGVGLTFLVLGTAFAETAIPVRLDPIGGSGVSGTANLIAVGDGTEVSSSLTGLQPGVSYQVSVAGGTCATPGASVAPVFTATGDAQGRASGTGPVQFRGTDPVLLVALASGDHIVRVHQVGNADVACGPIVQITSGIQHLPSTGGPGPAILLGGAGALAAVLVTGGLDLRRRARAL